MCRTLCSHEVCKVPDEFTDDVLFPFLVEHVVVALQDGLLVLLCKHHGRVLEEEKHVLLPEFFGNVCDQTLSSETWKSEAQCNLQQPSDFMIYVFNRAQHSGICVCECVYPHGVKPGHCVCSILALNDGFLVLSVPALKLRVELDGDDLHVSGVMIPGEVTVHTDHVHKRSLKSRETIRKVVNLFLWDRIQRMFDLISSFWRMTCPQTAHACSLCPQVNCKQCLNLCLSKPPVFTNELLQVMGTFKIQLHPETSSSQERNVNYSAACQQLSSMWGQQTKNNKR